MEKQKSLADLMPMMAMVMPAFTGKPTAVAASSTGAGPAASSDTASVSTSSTASKTPLWPETENNFVPRVSGNKPLTADDKLDGAAALADAMRSARNEAVVRHFLRGWDNLDVAQCMNVCTEDMTYLNQPLEAIRGKENVGKMLASIFAPAKKANFIIHTCIGRGNTVVAERTDQWDWTGSGHWEMELHVTGIFELTPDGLIYEWREYYDNEYWRNHHGPSLVWTPHANKPQPRSKSSSETTVRKFIEGWSLKDADYLMSLMSDDIVYINQPLPPVVGQKDVKKIVKGIIDLTHGKVEWKLLNLFATSDGSVICSERLDQWDFTGSGKWELLLPCVGMFEINEEGLITSWKDYFETSLWFEKGGPTLHV